MCMSIITERLVLEPLDPERAGRLADGDVSGTTPGAGWPYDDTPLMAAVAAASPAATTWLITRDGAVIGECGMKHAIEADGSVEIGYGLAVPWRSHGYGAEAIGGMLEWLENLPECRRVVAEIHQTNMASRRLVERLGFTVDRLDPPYVWYAR